MITHMLRHWLPGTSSKSSLCDRGYKPHIDLLEDRTVPAFVVTDLTTTTSAALIKNLASGGTDTIANVKYTGAPTAAGIFTDTKNTVGIGSGVVLSSGTAKGIIGPNNDPALATSNGTADDPDLDILASPNPGFDASVLEFDYTPKGSFVALSFVFGSEEYPDFAPPVDSGFNDVFGFFVNGKNYAYVPGTTTPVSPDSINPVTNTKYYVNNYTNIFGPIYGTHNTQMNAYTKVLQVTLPVQRGVPAHIKLAVEDATDDIYDTWVLIKLGSLASHNVTATNPARFVYSPATGLFSGSFNVINANNFSYQGAVYLIFNSLPPGVTLMNATGTTPSGHKYIKVSNSLVANSSFHINLTFSNPFKLNLGTYFAHLPMTVSGILL